MRTLLSHLALLVIASASMQAADVSLLRVPDAGIQPQAAVDERGNLDLIYFNGDPAAGELYFVQRKAGGAAFSPPIRVNRDDSAAIALGTIRGAQLALGKAGRVHVAWMGSTKEMKPVPPDKYPQAPMFYARLNDAGTAFETPRNLITRTSGLDGGGSIAADGKGNVYVAWHGREAGAPDGEAGRAMYVSRSSDNGESFAPEIRANADPTGACACCGMKAYADETGRLFLLYRTVNDVRRDMILLTSRDAGKSFTSRTVSSWMTQSCPMSSSTIAESRNDLLVATESSGRAEWVRLELSGDEPGSASFMTSTPAKHPSVAVNRDGEVVLAWAADAGWARGGVLHWQQFDAHGHPIGSIGGGMTLPTWSFPDVVCPDGRSFLVIY